ncbi:Gfo/Idh/MocA family protein [Kaistia nematophila]|uniref:Gfo/Idh/MocA family oxidoreductase n=1 Tax=Kaistia nematophila TaxID=2994654 RepID=A0A9X3E4Y0_9HYPH|nr:Gfo/Idh/MocA family oxidoreductase [Kaistia nematophila]MCX5571619.1 Gfo/Idh/MocA family oxidoreductase [Kaistia nematophila]
MTSFDPASLVQAWPLPTAPRPIVIIGAGGIVNDAHLPAYALAGFPVAGIFDRDVGRAKALAEQWGVPFFRTLDEAVAARDAIFDLATPPAAHLEIMRRLPKGATVLIQKPMGRDLDEATAILNLCRERQFKAAVNFQLRFSPMMLAVRDALQRGLLGRLVDVEMHLNLVTPWHLFPFLKGMSRVEIAVHSIHYLDLIRGMLGNPTGIHARTLGHPGNELAQTRTSAMLDFGPDVRCTLSINHDHDFGRKFQDATFRFEGDQGAASVKLGLLLNYPAGEPDELWITAARGADADWRQVPLAGGWFPNAFAGVMSNLQRFSAGEDDSLVTSVEDAWHTMALVEAAFRSAAEPATPVPQQPG